MTADMRELAKAKGIADEFIDAWGELASITDASKQTMLAAMGYRVDEPEELAGQLAQESQLFWTQPLEPVQILTEGEQELQLEIKRPIAVIDRPLRWRLEPEQGKIKQGALKLTDGDLIGVGEVNELEYQCWRLPLSIGQLPLGYHQFELFDDSEMLAEMSLIVTPAQCYKPEVMTSGQKVWGVSVQLYCLRSERNWGIGDFTDLAYLVEQIAQRGGQFVGLNPIHALYPANPEAASPYSPSSRRWLNIAYIDVEAIPELSHNKHLKGLLAEDEFQQKLEQLRSSEWVDYKEVTQAKLEFLRKIFDEAHLGERTARGRKFAKFIEAGGESLLEQACYDAMQAWFYSKGMKAWGWSVWPDEYNEYHKPAVQQWIKQHERDVRFYLYLQWLASEQLEAVEQLARDKGMLIGLYRDLAVGVSEGGTEIWANSALYCPKASAGAPPDVLGPLGQNWGLPPMNPSELYQSAYQPMVELFRSNMQACGALRIDHIMGLLRLWWVAAGECAKTGAYVYYPVEDLLAILALESHRNQCLVIGEDLGTVPDEIRTMLREHGVYSYRVFLFERAKDGGFYSPKHYPEQAMAVLTTHDMATLEGFWNCEDLELGRKLGIYPDPEQLQQLYDSRHQSKQRILDSMLGHGTLPESVSADVSWCPMTQELNHGMQKHLALCSSALLSFQLEDWLEMDQPVNVPGTSDEYPNWRRKLTRNLSELFANPKIDQLTADLTRIRREVSKKD
ncbi:4-alpha-glucanotransferase [Dongshaea marina]|uniref:4-alpha-glucanotransferase n=1 Tax=Dongshaea marina TaxID=2047966 RepID=UPI000D3E33BF|nr:4-alpha-glucanotransferase [Dongshaea marina]